MLTKGCQCTTPTHNGIATNIELQCVHGLQVPACEAAGTCICVHICQRRMRETKTKHGGVSMRIACSVRTVDETTSHVWSTKMLNGQTGTKQNCLRGQCPHYIKWRGLSP